MKKIKNLLIIGLAILLIFTGVKFYSNMKVDEKVETLSNNIQESIDNITEISTVKYNYTDIAEYENSLQFSGMNIPFGNKTFLVKYSGYIKAGLDVKEIETEVIDLDKVIVELGETKILDNVIMEEEVFFYNEKDSAFNRLEFNDLYEVLKTEKANKEEEVLEKGILNDAKVNGKKSIEIYLKELGFKEIEFKEMEVKEKE